MPQVDLSRLRPLPRSDSVLQRTGVQVGYCRLSAPDAETAETIAAADGSQDLVEIVDASGQLPPDEKQRLIDWAAAADERLAQVAAAHRAILHAYSFTTTTIGSQDGRMLCYDFDCGQWLLRCLERVEELVKTRSSPKITSAWT